MSTVQEDHSGQERYYRRSDEAVSYPGKKAGKIEGQRTEELNERAFR